MEFRNFSGIARSITPFPIDAPLSKDQELPNTTFRVKVQIFDGTIPNNLTLLNIKTEEDLNMLTDAYTKLLEFDNIGFFTTYDELRKIRMFKKVPIGNTIGTGLGTGTASWGAIIFNNGDSDLTEERSMIFTEKVSDSTEEDKLIYLQNINVELDSDNYLQDIVFNVRDICTTVDIPW